MTQGRHYIEAMLLREYYRSLLKVARLGTKYIENMTWEIGTQRGKIIVLHLNFKGGVNCTNVPSPLVLDVHSFHKGVTLSLYQNFGIELNWRSL